MKTGLGLAAVVCALLMSGCIKDPFADADSGTFQDKRDNQEYGWVRIGAQIWMSENLAWLPSVNPPATLSDKAACYYVYGYDGSSVSAAMVSPNYSTYGVLYNWTAAQNACPEGWHLPTDAEWTTLTNHLGGIAAAGAGLKSSTGWFNNGNGNNSSGFNAKPAGGLDHQYGFSSLDYLGVFCTATANSDSETWNRGMSYLTAEVNRGLASKSDGNSVRCIKD